MISFIVLAVFATQSPVDDVGQAAAEAIIATTGRDERANSVSTLNISCKKINLKIDAPYDDSFHHEGRVRMRPRILLNGVELRNFDRNIMESISRRRAFSKYSSFCLDDGGRALIKYYSVTREGHNIVYISGGFSIDTSGKVRFLGEERVAGDDFWFG